MKAIRIKTEFLTNPIGVDFQNPVITWCCEGGERQTAYCIVAKSGDGVVWDTGRVQTDSMKATYPHKLISRQRVDYTVTLWDENGLEGEPSSAFFEMGLLAGSDWQAEWISGDYRIAPRHRYQRTECLATSLYNHH